CARVKKFSSGLGKSHALGDSQDNPHSDCALSIDITFEIVPTNRSRRIIHRRGVGGGLNEKEQRERDVLCTHNNKPTKALLWTARPFPTPPPTLPPPPPSPRPPPPAAPLPPSPTVPPHRRRPHHPTPWPPRTARATPLPPSPQAPLPALQSGCGPQNGPARQTVAVRTRRRQGATRRPRTRRRQCDLRTLSKRKWGAGGRF
ncbi:hypothetical protein DFJ73DRAFT_140196, partial [Zopfochytrium polystomum]